MKKSKLSHRIAAAVTVGAMMGVSGEALAGNATTADMANLTQNIATTTGNFNTLMSLLGYVGGTGMSIAGIFKLKAHVDSPANAPLKDGLMRLAAGGALLSLPLIVRVHAGRHRQRQPERDDVRSHHRKLRRFVRCGRRQQQPG